MGISMHYKIHFMSTWKSIRPQFNKPSIGKWSLKKMTFRMYVNKNGFQIKSEKDKFGWTQKLVSFLADDEI